VDGAHPITKDGGEMLLNRTWRPQLATIGADGKPTQMYLLTLHQVFQLVHQQEMSSDLKPRFNSQYGELLVVLEILI
jgi:hypothetical protein